MTSSVTPVWTDSTVIVTPTKLSSGGAGWGRGTIDLRTKNGGFVFCKIGRLTTTALATAINVYIRRVLNNGATGTNLPFTHPSQPTFQSQIATTVCPTVATSNQSAGSQTLILSAGTSMVAGDIICISDSGGTTFARTEFKTISKVVTATLTLAEGLDYAHTTAQADIVSRLADVFAPFPIAGGSLYEVIFDYQVSATGGDVVVMAHFQSYDSNLIT